MVLTLEVCTVEERCQAFDKKYEELIELREKLREWLRASPHLPQEIPDAKLEFFVLNSKMSLERAKKKLDMHYTLRRLIPEIFANRDPLSLRLSKTIKSLTWIPLPKLTPQKCRICITKILKPDDGNFDPWDYFKYVFMTADIRAMEDSCLGDVYIQDLAGMRWSFATKFTPTILKKCEVIGTKGYGSRILGMHYINAPSFLDRVLSLVKSAVKQKIAERIQVHSSLESLYKFVPKSILPVDYGGDELPLEELSEKWVNKMVDFRDWYIKEENVLTNEALRPGPTVNPDDLFGTYGSFRKLDVD